MNQNDPSRVIPTRESVSEKGFKRSWMPKGRYGLPPSWFYVFFWDPPPKKNKWHFWKKRVFTGRLFLSQKNTRYDYYLLYFMKETRFNVYHSEYESRTGREKVISNEEKGWWGPEKDAHLIMTPLFTCRVCARFQPKNSQKDHEVFCRTPPPSLTAFCRGFTRTTLPPLTDHVVCLLSLNRSDLDLN